MNKVILIGRLTKDPDLRTTTNGLSVATFTLAVNRPYQDQSGERNADFISCVIWRKSAETLGKYVKKGQELAVEGSIQTRTYDHQDGTKRYITEVLCDRFEFIGGQTNNRREDTNANANNNYYDSLVPPVDEPSTAMPANSTPVSNAKTTDITEDPFKDFGSEISLSDDDLPF